MVKHEFEPIHEYDEYTGDANYEQQNELSRLVQEEGNLTRSKSKKNVTFNMEPPSIVMYESLTPELGPESPLMHSEDEFHDDDLHDHHPVIEPGYNDFFNDDIITPISAPRRPLPMIPQVDLVDSESEEEVPAPVVNLDSPSMDNSVKAVFSQRSLSDNKLNEIENTIDDAHQVSRESRGNSLGPDSKEYIREALIDHQLPEESPMVGSFSEYEQGQYEAQFDHNGRLVIPVNLTRKESLLDNERKISTKHHVPTIDSHSDEQAQMTRRVSQRRRSVIKALENESKPAESVIAEEEEESDESEDFQDSEEAISEKPTVEKVAAVAPTVGVASAAAVGAVGVAAAGVAAGAGAKVLASKSVAPSDAPEDAFEDSKEEFSFSSGLNEALKNEYQGSVHLSQILPDELSEQARDMSDVPGEHSMSSPIGSSSPVQTRSVPAVSSVETPVPLPPVEHQSDWSSSFSHVTGESKEKSQSQSDSSGSFGHSFNQTTTELHPEEKSVMHDDAPTDEESEEESEEEESEESEEDDSEGSEEESEEEEEEEVAAPVVPVAAAVPALSSLPTPHFSPFEHGREIETEADQSVMFDRSVRNIKTEVVDADVSVPAVKSEPVDFEEFDADSILKDIPRGDLSNSVRDSGRFSFGPEASFSVKKADEDEEFVPAVPAVPLEHQQDEESEEESGSEEEEEEESEEEESEEEEETDAKSLALSQTTTRESHHSTLSADMDKSHSDIESETPLLVNKKIRSAAPQLEEEDTAPITVSSFSDFSLPTHRDFTPLMGFESPAEQDSPMKTTGILTSNVKGEKRDITPFFPKMETFEKAVEPELERPVLHSALGDGRYDDAEEEEVEHARDLVADAESREREPGYDFGSADESESPVKGEFIKHEHVPIKPEPQFELVEPVEPVDESRGVDESEIGMMTALNDEQIATEAPPAPPMPEIPVEHEHAVADVNKTVDLPVLPVNQSAELPVLPVDVTPVDVAPMERAAEVVAEQAVHSDITPVQSAAAPVTPVIGAPETPVTPVTATAGSPYTPRSMIIDDVPVKTQSPVVAPAARDRVSPPLAARDRMAVKRVPVGGAGGVVPGAAVGAAVGAVAVVAGGAMTRAPAPAAVPPPSLPRDPSQVGLMTALMQTEPDEDIPPLPPMPDILPDILPAELSGQDLEEEDEFDPDATPESVNVSRSAAAPVIPTPNLPTPNFHTPLRNFGVSPEVHGGVNNSIVPDQVSVIPEWNETGGDMTAPGFIAVGADGDTTVPTSAGSAPLPSVPTPALPAIPGEEEHSSGRFDSAYTTGRFDSAADDDFRMSSGSRFDPAEDSPVAPVKRELSQYSLSLGHSPDEFGDQFRQYEPGMIQDIPVKEEFVPEDQQTIKMHGRNNSVRARKSLAPEEVSRFTHARRKISGDFGGLGYNDTMRDLSSRGSDDSEYDNHLQREISQTPIKLPAPKLEFSIEDLTEDTESMFADLESEFDRVISVQKRGYSLRENNRIVIANGPAREINRRLSGPVKQWDGNNVEEPTPAMPAMPEQYRSMVSDPGASVGDAVPGAKTVQAPAAQIRSKKAIPSSQRMPTVESGRLFVRLLGLKDLDLPGVDSKNAVLSLTMDNGIHCITTPYESLRRSTRLDQEFELTVEKDLEFILTLRTRWKKKAAPVVERRPSNSSMSTKNKLGKLFGKKSDPRLNAGPPAPVDAWDSLTAKDGSFGRSYIAFAQYEQEIYGKPGVFEVNCFNEWTESGGKKRQPYKIAKLEIELMYIPRGSKSETLPVSIEAAQQTLQEASVKTHIETEGFMSQHGGDCKYWRRRYFTLRGTTLTAYSETSRKPRATINLAKAVAVVADKSTLSQPTVEVGRDKQRRKSVFAAESDGFLMANEGFRLRFANGEIIDFYADSEQVKDSWVGELKKVVGTQQRAQPWVDLVLARREYEKNTKK